MHRRAEQPVKFGATHNSKAINTSRCQRRKCDGAARRNVPTSVAGVRLWMGSNGSERHLIHSSRPARFKMKSMKAI